MLKGKILGEILFPYVFKIIGFVLSVFALLTPFLIKQTGWSSVHAEKEILKKICYILLCTGLALAAAAKDKNETEVVKLCREKARKSITGFMVFFVIVSSLLALIADGVSATEDSALKVLFMGLVMYHCAFYFQKIIQAKKASVKK